MKPTDKVLHSNKWLSLLETENGYVYSRSTRSNGALVAILIFDKTQEHEGILGRYEFCPAHDDGFALASFTGGVENDDPLATAVHEIKEEAGYIADPKELFCLGTCRPSKSSDTVCHLYSWNANGQVPGEILGDGSEGEKGAYTKWINASELLECKDPLMAVLMLRHAFIRDFK